MGSLNCHEPRWSCGGDCPVIFQDVAIGGDALTTTAVDYNLAQ